MLPSLSIKEFFHLHSFFFLYILKFSLGGWLVADYSRRLHGSVWRLQGENNDG